MSQLYRQFFQIAVIEGVSYLVLLLVAMPLKYGLGLDLVVTYVGWAHGVLFVLYFIWLARCWIALKWPFKAIVIAAIASLIPAATFFLHRFLPEAPEA